MPTPSEKTKTPHIGKITLLGRWFEQMFTLPVWLSKIMWCGGKEYLTRTIYPERIEVEQIAALDASKADAKKAISAHVDAELEKVKQLNCSTDTVGVDLIAMFELAFLRELHDKRRYWHSLIVNSLIDKGFSPYRQNDVIYFAKKPQSKTQGKMVEIKDWLKK